MSDIDKYIAGRENKSKGFKNKVNFHYDNLKIGMLLKELRLKSGLTQQEMAGKLNTTKSVVSRTENHAESVRLDTLEKFARALDKQLVIRFE